MQAQGTLESAILPGRGNLVLGRLWPAPWLFEFSGLTVQIRPDLKGLQAARYYELASRLVGNLQILHEGEEVL